MSVLLVLVQRNSITISNCIRVGSEKINQGAVRICYLIFLNEKGNYGEISSNIKVFCSVKKRRNYVIDP
jgi:hypothetical protein